MAMRKVGRGSEKSEAEDAISLDPDDAEVVGLISGPVRVESSLFEMREINLALESFCGWDADVTEFHL